MESFGPLLDIINRIWNPIGKCLKYHRSLDKNMKILDEKMEELNCRKSDKESQIKVELCSGKILKKEVDLWLQKVQKINNEKQTLEQEVGKRKYVSRARLGRLANKKIQEVEKLHKKGSFPDGLMVDAAPKPKQEETFPTTTIIVGETTAKRKMEEIWTSIISDDVLKIGLYGMGGSGKTTIMKHIRNHILQNKDKFDNVFWITVSEAKDIIKLQSDIASALDVDISRQPDEVMRATMLYNKLKEKRRYVLIFDDMWEAFDLEDVGIPEPTIENGSKVILTTRSLDVCRKWRCKCIKMELLSEDEAWNLFMDKVGSDVVLTSNLEAIAKLVAKECACLPLALITIGRSMMGITDEREWRNALKELRKSTEGLNEMGKVIERLKYSYTHLKDERLQQCLLFCGLYPEDYMIKRRELIVYLIAEDIIKGAGSRQERFDEGHSILNKLENACLLDNCTDSRGVRCVKMHDVVRDMVLQIMGRGSFVEAGVQLRDFPDKQNWTEDLERVSLMDNYIEEIPTDASPRCSRLKTLLLLRNAKLTRIPDPFFAHMFGLRVLDLSHTRIEILPNSVSGLLNLTALIAAECMSLRYVPSLASLLALEELDLGNTAIQEVPQGIEMLTNLRYLSLITMHLNSFPTGILPKFSHLQWLVILWGSKTLKLKGDEVAALSKLEMLSCQFYDLDDFNTYIQLHQWRLPNRYYLQVGPIKPNTGGLPNIYASHYRGQRKEREDQYMKCVVLRKCNIREVEDSLELPNDIEELYIEECNDICSLSDIPSFNNASVMSAPSCSSYRTCATALLRLRVLKLIDLHNLHVLFEEGGVPSPPLPPGTFSCLTKLLIQDCEKTKHLFTPGMVPYLQNLEQLFVWDCYKMEVLIATEGEEQEGSGEGCNNHSIVNNDDDNDAMITISLPKLKVLGLSMLTNMKSIIRSRRWILTCNAIENITVFRCWDLKRLPISLPVRNGQPSPPPSLTMINTNDIAWWDSLEWDNPVIKDVLQSFVRIQFLR